MPRTKIKEIRRNEIVENEIVEAAMSEIGRTGSTDITVAKIADLAGVSRGLRTIILGARSKS